MNKGNKRDNIKKIEHKKLNKSKVVKISLSLFVVIIFVILFAVSLQISKTTKTGVEVSDNLAESATEEIIEDETTINDDSEVSAISETTENENTDAGISTIADSSDYTITVTEYTGDTLEVEYDYYNSDSLILYVLDAETLELVNVAVIDSFGEYDLSDYYNTWEETLNEGYKSVSSPLFADASFEYVSTVAVTSALFGTDSLWLDFELVTDDCRGWTLYTADETEEAGQVYIEQNRRNNNYNTR